MGWDIESPLTRRLAAAPSPVRGEGWSERMRVQATATALLPRKMTGAYGLEPQASLQARMPSPLAGEGGRRSDRVRGLDGNEGLLT